MAYHYDANNILVAPLRNITGTFILNVITNIHGKLKQWGLTPKLHIIDNEVSEDLKEYVEESDIQFQLVSPHIYQRYASERATIPFKNHFISSLHTIDPLFPLYLWYWLWPQVTMTLNILRRCRLNPELSSYKQVDGMQIFERTPLPPFGCKVKFTRNHTSNSHMLLTHYMDGNSDQQFIITYAKPATTLTL